MTALPQARVQPPVLRPDPVIRSARAEDLDRLLTLENRCFEHDRLSRRSFRHFLSSDTASCLVAERDGELLGYVLVLFHGRTALARLYSMAVAPEHRAQGLGRVLLDAAEAVALDGGAAIMRLEVHPANFAAIALYRRAGYLEFGIYRGFYEDDSDALRMQHVLVPRLQPDLSGVPHYRQTLEFTCGPAALMMAMKALNRRLRLDRRLEISLWRESTTIFMTSGHGGCSPHGLALAAWRRGFAVELFVNDEGPPFLDTVRTPDKKEVVRLVHQDFLEEIRRTDIQVHRQPLSADELSARVAAGAIPVVMISQYRIYGDKEPHWIIVSGCDQRFIYAHDPYISDAHVTTTDRVSIPILRREFELMARYGRSRLQAAIIVSKRDDAR
ncbi:MAG TPA: GNAT family N-acetyltransferase/peptidase C39 family protein [Geminicoccaceae bacterium]|nr:GNAT family N-acetyltransferase/peptidase C39 family protein [Geminicoccaceae bacterium]